MHPQRSADLPSIRVRLTRWIMDISVAGGLLLSLTVGVLLHETLDDLLDVPTDINGQEELAAQWDWSEGPYRWIKAGVKNGDVARELARADYSPTDVKNSEFRAALTDGKPPSLIRIAEAMVKHGADPLEALELAEDWSDPKHKGRAHGLYDDPSRFIPERWFSIGVFHVDEKEDWLEFSDDFNLISRWAKRLGADSAVRAKKWLTKGVDDPSAAARMESYGADPDDDMTEEDIKMILDHGAMVRGTNPALRSAQRQR